MGTTPEVTRKNLVSSARPQTTSTGSPAKAIASSFVAWIKVRLCGSVVVYQSRYVRTDYLISGNDQAFVLHMSKDVESHRLVKICIVICLP